MADDLRHRCDNCEGISPETCLFAPRDTLAVLDDTKPA